MCVFVWRLYVSLRLLRVSFGNFISFTSTSIFLSSSYSFPIDTGTVQQQFHSHSPIRMWSYCSCMGECAFFRYLSDDEDKNTHTLDRFSGYVNLNFTTFRWQLKIHETFFFHFSWSNNSLIFFSIFQHFHFKILNAWNSIIFYFTRIISFSFNCFTWFHFMRIKFCNSSQCTSRSSH